MVHFSEIWNPTNSTSTQSQVQNLSILKEKQFDTSVDDERMN